VFSRTNFDILDLTVTDDVKVKSITLATRMALNSEHTAAKPVNCQCTTNIR